MQLTINRVEFKELKGIRYAFYFTLVKVDGKWCSFVSHHKCDGMSDMQAQTAFKKEHFQEVEQLMLQKIKQDSIILN